MKMQLTAGILLAGLALATPSEARHRGRPEVPGPLVGVSVDVDHRSARLYPAPDRSGRYYLEAHEGSSYVLHLDNRTGERLGVVVSVDGLNAISGARDRGRGRMYVLGPWQRTTVRGWRTSLEDVRRFTFVDEKASYAARSGKANSRMGWIELKVFREKRRWTRRDLPEDRVSRPDEAGRPADRAEAPPPSAKAGDAEAESSEARSQAARSYPGTGWGRRAHDPVRLVTFEPERSPAQETTLRYEYRDALVALGVLPAPPRHPDRLAERDRGGFAPPPLW
jgi:hypothetical protein